MNVWGTKPPASTYDATAKFKGSLLLGQNTLSNQGSRFEVLFDLTNPLPKTTNAVVVIESTNTAKTIYDPLNVSTENEYLTGVRAPLPGDEFCSTSEVNKARDYLELEDSDYFY